ncbi:MAG: hypothetical protein VXY20_03365, partial [Pseudomonadota bacterium]|nr:hypothetical protein [Pseudomonadota bacterium]
ILHQNHLTKFCSPRAKNVVPVVVKLHYTKSQTYIPTGMRAVIQSVETILSTPSTETLTTQYGKKDISDAMRGTFHKFRNLIQKENSVETTA